MSNDGRLLRPKLAYERNFTQIPNEWLRDPKLGLRVRGLLALLLSHDEGYVVTFRSLAAQGVDGDAAIRTGVQELKQAGYLELRKERDSTRPKLSRIGLRHNQSLSVKARSPQHNW